MSNLVPPHEVRNEDILVGRAGANSKHPGNLAFKAMIHSRVKPYSKCDTKRQRTAITVGIDISIRKAQARFLEATKNGWAELDQLTSRRKIMETIRYATKATTQSKFVPGKGRQRGYTFEFNIQFSHTATFAEIIKSVPILRKRCDPDQPLFMIHPSPKKQSNPHLPPYLLPSKNDHRSSLSVPTFPPPSTPPKTFVKTTDLVSPRVNDESIGNQPALSESILDILAVVSATSPSAGLIEPSLALASDSMTTILGEGGTAAARNVLLRRRPDAVLALRKKLEQAYLEEALIHEVSRHLKQKLIVELMIRSNAW